MNFWNRTRSASLCLFAGLSALGTTNLTPKAQAITLTISSTKRSDIKGWGLVPSYYNGSRPEQNYTEQTKPLVSDAVYGVGQSFVRLELSGGYYRSADAAFSVNSITFNTTNSNNPGSWAQDRMDYMVNEMNLAKSKGVSKYILSSWSPPDAFKTVGTPTTPNTFTLAPDNPIRYGTTKLSTGETIRTCLRQDREAAYCNWYVAAMKYLIQQTGWTPTAISIQNEPTMLSVGYSGCYWDAAQYYRVAKLMRSTMNANGLSGVIILGHDDTFRCTTSTDHSASPAPAGIFGWTFPVLTPNNANYDATLAAAIGGYAFHSYDLGDQWGTTGGEYTVRTNGGPPRDIWMTEWNDHNENSGDGGGMADIDFTIKCFRHLACDFVTMPYNYWCYWTAWTRENGVVNGGELLGSQNVGGVSQPIYSKKYPIFQKIYQTVKAGEWVSKTVATDDVELQSKKDQYQQYQPNLVSLIAFEKNDATASLLVISNPSTTARSGVVISGLKGSSAVVYQTTASQTMSQAQFGTITSGQFTLTTLPARSVVLVSSSSNIVSGNIYKIIAVHSNKALEANANSTSDQVRQWTYNGGSNQKWKVETVGTNIYKLTVQSSQKALAISTQTNNGLDAGCLTISQSYTSATNQQFRIEKMSDGNYKIVSNNSNFPLDVSGANQNDGATVVQWWDTSNTNQRWRFETP